MTGPSTRTIQGDCIEVMATLEADSFDAIITDPPYGIAFMGQDWDSFKAKNVTQSQVVKNLGSGMKMTTAAENKNFQVWCEAWATQALRVVKPGGWVIAFCAPRTYHRMAAGLEDAGLEIHNSFVWMFGSGFPKSMDISKAIDKAAGAEREVVREGTPPPSNFKSGTFNNRGPNSFGNGPITAPATPEAKQWAGWGTALKPAYEIAVMARKPLSEKTIVANVLKHGTGAINIDAGRIPLLDGEDISIERNGAVKIDTREQGWGFRAVSRGNEGRFPSNLIHDGSDEVLAVFPQAVAGSQGGYEGSAARFFAQFPADADDALPGNRMLYCAKASKGEKDRGCLGLPIRRPDTRTEAGMGTFDEKGVQPGRNHHPTVKPMALMAYLCRLVTPPGGIVLDPFCGSGTTLKAALSEGFSAVGIEKDAAYFEIVESRLDGAQIGLPLCC